MTLDDPGAVVGSSVGLTATASPDTTDVTFRYRTVGSGGAGTLIASDGTAPFAVTWTTAPAAEMQWELIAVATDAGGNVTTSAPRVVLVDRTQPTGSVTAPANGDTTGGPTVAIAANAADLAGSGVTSVVWEVMEFGSAVFTPVATDTSAPYSTTWNSTSSPDGATSIRAVITDAAGNTSTTAAVSFSLDSTGPSVSLADPGAIVGGTIALSATTGGGAARVVFSVAPAGTGTWTEIANDTGAPFGTPFDTSTLPDALYDLRAVGFDALDNASAPALRTNVRFDNTAPILVSSTPADGTVSTSANQIVLTANEPVTAPGALLNGVAAPAPTISGSTLTFSTGPLPDGIHVLSGELEDASGARSQFRVAVSIQNIPTSDPPPVERSITAGGDFTVTLPGGLVTVKMPAGAWPTPPTPQDYILVLRVDAGPAGPGFVPGTQIVEVTARWALAGTYVTEFNVPIEINFSNPTGVPAIAGWSESARNPAESWNTMSRLEDSTLPIAQRDGFHGDPQNAHVLTRHLTFFGLLLDDVPPSPPRHIAGVVAADGLTIRWIAGFDASERARQHRALRQRRGVPHLRPAPVRDENGAVHARRHAQRSRSRSTTRPETSAPQSQVLQAVPPLVGKSLDQAVATLAAAGFELGTVREQPVAAVAPGTVVGPTAPRHAVLSTKIDLVVSSAFVAPQTQLVFSVAASKTLTLKQRTTIAARVSVSKPASLTAMLSTAGKKRLYTWKVRRLKAGANVVKLTLPKQIRRPGTYTLTWIARSGTETVSRTIKLTLVGKKIAQIKASRGEIEVVLAGEQHPKNVVQSALEGSRARVVAQAGIDQTFALAASASRDVKIVVVDVDVHGVGFVKDLRTVFPAIRVIAIASQPADRVRALRAGAVKALPRNTTSRQLAKAIAAISSR